MFIEAGINDFFNQLKLHLRYADFFAPMATYIYIVRKMDSEGLSWFSLLLRGLPSHIQSAMAHSPSDPLPSLHIYEFETVCRVFVTTKPNDALQCGSITTKTISANFNLLKTVFTLDWSSLLTWYQGLWMFICHLCTSKQYRHIGMLVQGSHGVKLKI